MAYGELSEGFKEYIRMREKELSGLESYDRILIPSELEELGFEPVESMYFTEDVEEHEFHVFEKGDCRAVYIQTYVEREGGLYYQGFFINGPCKKLLDELLKE
jgi:hypothetical protein